MGMNLRKFSVIYKLKLKLNKNISRMNPGFLKGAPTPKYNKLKNIGSRRDEDERPQKFSIYIFAIDFFCELSSGFRNMIF